MRLTNSKHHRRRDREAGYMLFSMLLTVTLIVLSLTLELPTIGVEIRRQREEEMIHRGAQYARAVKRFYRKFGRYPLTVEQLENTDGMRFLRRRYTDPITGKNFRIIHLNEVQFGETPLTAVPGFNVDSRSDNSPASTNCVSASNASPLSSGAFTAILPTAGTSGAGRVRSGPLTSGYATDSIVGVTSTSTKTGIRTFNNKDTYRDWMFIYDGTWDIGNLITGPYSAQGRITKTSAPCQVTRKPSGSNDNTQ